MARRRYNVQSDSAFFDAARHHNSGTYARPDTEWRATGFCCETKVHFDGISHVSQNVLYMYNTDYVTTGREPFSIYH